MNHSRSLPELDPVIHGQIRLALMSLLAGVEEAEFTWLRNRTGATAGNLGANLLQLEESEYISVKKKFAGKKPVSSYRLTARGHRALESYVRDLKQLLGDVL